MRRRVWTTQPPDGTPIDWDSPLADGLAAVGVPWGPTPVDPASHGRFHVANTANPYPTVVDAGYGSAWLQGSNQKYTVLVETLPNLGTSMELLVIADQLLGVSAYIASESNQYFRVGATVSGSSTYPYGIVNNVSQLTGAIPLTGNGPWCLGIGSGPGVGTQLWVNGALAASSASAFYHNGGNLGFSPVAGDQNQRIYASFLYGRVLQPSERFALSNNPWQIFHRRRRAYSIPTSSGAAGTAAITEASDTVSATGNIAIPGTASITEASDTVAATGAIAVAGTAAITEGSDAVAATGVGGEVGTAAITEADDAVSAAGALSVTGSATITEGADTVAATGSAGSGATAAITEQHDATAATGGIALSGAATIFEGGDIVVGTGAFALPGSASITEGHDSVVAQGSVPTQVTQGSPQWTISRSFTRNFTVRRSVPRSFTLSRSYTRNFTVTPMAVRFPIKGTSEKVPLTFDFTQDLPSGVTLTGTPVLGVSVSNGTDSNPTGILNGAAGFNSGSTQVIQPVQGGVNGVDYAVTCTCTTTQSNLTLSLVGLLSVRRDLN